MLFEEQKLEVIEDIFKELHKKISIGEQNRNNSLKQLKEENKEIHEKIIISAIRDGYTNARTISAYIEVEISTVRARLSDLCKKKDGIIEEKGKIYYKDTNRMITSYGFKNRLFN